MCLPTVKLGFEVRDHKARVVFRLAIGMAHDLRLDDDTPALIPRTSRIAGLAVDMLGLAGFSRQPPGVAHQARGATLKNLVFPHRDDVLESLALKKGKQWCGCEAAIEAHPQPGARESGSPSRPQAAQDPDTTHRGAGRARAEPRG